MAILYVFGLTVYYWLVLRRQKPRASTLSLILWTVYLCLGLSGTFITLSGGIESVFPPNYLSTIFLLTCTLISISGFLPFREQKISRNCSDTRNLKYIENFLIFSQLLAIVFFFPFAIQSLIGDPHENRLFLEDKMQILGSYGILNTVAGASSQLFVVSIALAFSRLTSEKKYGRDVFRAAILIISSLSYVIYILAYVGRDGVVYWLMTAVALYLVFRTHIENNDRKKIKLLGAIGAFLLLIPFGIITISRFFDADQGASWSFFEYFGAQIHNFSDYSSIDRPKTLGAQSFPIFVASGCSLLQLSCQTWMEMKDDIFSLYLDQGKVPWVFGTFISDFVGDFGYAGTFILITCFSRICSIACSSDLSNRSYSLSRLTLILFLFLIPFWGVFYFRFSIINGYIIVNIAFVVFVWLLQKKFRSSGSSQ